MNERLCLITGANSGIGKEAAIGLSRMGARVVIVCRDQSRGEAALNDIKERSRNQSADLMICDLSSQLSIRQLATDFLHKYQDLHILINSAGLYLPRRTLTEDGIETQFAVNYLAPFLLTELLLGTLKKSAPARVINVSSSAHRRGSIHFDDLQREKKRYIGGIGAYSDSKLALVLFTHELAKRLEGTGISVNAVHPGVVKTNIGQHSLLLRFIWIVSRPFMLSVAKGAEPLIYLATSPEIEGISGKYFDREKETRSSPKSYDELTGQRLWEVSAKLTNL